MNPGTRERHEFLNKLSQKGQGDIVFIGDSITQKWDAEGREVWETRWQPRGAVNFGVSGDRTEHVIWRLQNGNLTGLDPKLAILLIGTNNIGHKGRRMTEHGGARYSSTPEQTAKGVSTIISQLRQHHPEMKILLLSILPRGLTTDDTGRRQADLTNRLLVELHDGGFIHYLNITKSFLNPDGTLQKALMPDSLHLSTAGYLRWTHAIEWKVNELLR